MSGKGQKQEVRWRLAGGAVRLGEILGCEFTKGIKVKRLKEGFLNVYQCVSNQQRKKTAPVSRYTALYHFILLFKAARQDRRCQFLWARLWSCVQLLAGTLPGPPVGSNHTVKLPTGWCKAKSWKRRRAPQLSRLRAQPLKCDYKKTKCSASGKRFFDLK